MSLTTVNTPATFSPTPLEAIPGALIGGSGETMRQRSVELRDGR